MNRTVRRASALMVAGMLTVGLGACGDDDDEADADVGAGTEADEGTELAADASAGTEEFCEAVLAIDQVNLGLQVGESTPEDVEAAMLAAEDSAPGDIGDAVTTAADEARALLTAEESASPEGPPPMPGDAFYPAAAEIGAYVSDHCDVGTIDVTATEYSFGGFDETVPAGPTVLTFTNEGAEFHEMVLMQIAEGEERPVEELLTLPDEEVQSLVTDKGFVLAPPGAGNYVTADLEPGRYVALCFVPVGMTPEAMASGAAVDEADGHMMHGMVTEFEVA